MSTSFGTNVLKLLTSKIITQAISFITAPIIARIYLPEHFGIVQLFTSINGVIVVISCLRYELSIPLGKDKNEVMSSFMISIISVFMVSLLSFALVLILKENISLWLKSPDLKRFLWILPITVFLGGLGYSVSNYASWLGRFGTVAMASFGSTTASIFITIPLGLSFGASAKFLFIGQVAGMILNTLIIFCLLSPRFLSDIKTANLSFNILWDIAKRYKKFPIYDIWTALFNSVSMQLPPIILGIYFSNKVVGYYSLGNKFIGLPMILLGTSISQVFFPSAAKEYNETGKLMNIVNNTFKRLTQIGVFPFMVLGLFGDLLFGFVFGENWVEAGIYTQILSIYVLIRFISSPLSTIFSILKRQGTGLVLTLVQLVNRIVVLLIFAKLGSPRNCLLAYSLVSSTFYILVFYFVFRFSKASIGLGVKTFIKNFILSALLLLPTLFLVKIIDSIYFLFMVLIFDSIMYLFILYRFDSEIRIITRSIAGNFLTKKHL
ncbi:MAG: oligosaccharide flippase family protein [Candidatus Poribacteria bacterium]